jgi:hypothetical protein
VRRSIIFLLDFNFGIGVPAVETPSGPLTLCCSFCSKLECTRQDITELEGPEERSSTVGKTVLTRILASLLQSVQLFFCFYYNLGELEGGEKRVNFLVRNLERVRAVWDCIHRP